MAKDYKDAHKKFRIGDIVQLPSGSQKMTIVQVYEDGEIGVAWMAYGTGRLDTAIVPADALIRANN